MDDPLLAPIDGADHQSVAGVEVDVVRAGNGRLKRLVYPPGFRWSTHLKSVVGTDRCLHTHVGFLARGHIGWTYPDGCSFEAKAPQFAVIEAGHDAWVIGDEPAVFIQWDSEEGTARRFGLASEHTH